MVPEIIDDKTWILYAAKHYNNPACHDSKEFFGDLKRLRHIKKAYTKYEVTNEISDHSCRLILNHIIVLNNMFGPEVLIRLCFLRLDELLHFVKPFMIFLNIWPDEVRNIRGVNRVYTDGIGMDPNVINFLRRI